MSGIEVEQATWAPRCTLAESPRWHDGTWWWIDAPAGKVYRHTPGDDDAEVWLSLDTNVSLVHPADPPGMLVTAGTDLRLYAVTADGAAGEMQPLGDLGLPSGWRLNDGTGAPAGGLYIGVVSPDRDDQGYLRHVRPDGTLGATEPGIHLSNGIAFTSTTMYYADSYRRKILAFTLDDQGSPQAGREHLEFDEGIPDGLATDTEGGLWVAMYGLGEVHRYSEDGRRTLTVPVPTPQVTSVAFGHEDGRELLITTAREGYDEARSAAEPLAGMLFTARTQYRGAPLVPVTYS